MQNSRIITAIDVGTTKIFSIVAEKTGQTDLKVLGHSVVPCDGLKKGIISDVGATSRAIRASLEALEQTSGISVDSAYVGVTGAHIDFDNQRHPLEWAGKRGVITADEVTRVPQALASTGVESGRKIIHALPMTYWLDGMAGIKNPVGMHTRHLEVDTHVVTGSSTLIDKLVDATEGAGIKVEALVLEPLASSEALLTVEERNSGAALVDIGGGTTDVVVFQNGNICYTSVIPVGGYQFTNDICLTYNTPYREAEEAKLKYAHTDPSRILSDQEVSLPVADRTAELKVPLRDLSQLMRERAQELVRLISLALQEAQVEDVASLPLIMTGGTANLRGLQWLMQQTLTRRVRIGLPGGSIPRELRSPLFSTGVGILLWAIKQPEMLSGRSTYYNGATAEEAGDGLLARLFRQIKNLLPMQLISVN